MAETHPWVAWTKSIIWRRFYSHLIPV